MGIRRLIISLLSSNFSTQVLKPGYIIISSSIHPSSIHHLQPVMNSQLSSLQPFRTKITRFERAGGFLFHVARVCLPLFLLDDDAGFEGLVVLCIDAIQETTRGDGDVATGLVDQTVVASDVLLGEERVGCEEQVDLLEGSAGHLGVEEVDDGEGEDVEDAEDDEGLPAEAVQHDGDHEGVHAAADGPAQDREGVSAGAHLLRLDLGPVKPAGDDVE